MANYDNKTDKPGNAILPNGAVGVARFPAERSSVAKSANQQINGPGEKP
jgi:hypothetical protein